MKRKSQILLITFIILTTVLTLVSNPISNLIELPPAIKPFALPLLISIAILLCMIAIWQFILTSKENISLRTPSKQSRQRMLTKVQETWITGILENSLKEQALISLGLQEMPDMLANTWNLALEHPNQRAQALPSHTSIIEVYRKAVGELLILGEPGAGKTTLLLELCRELLKDARTDESQAIPIVFNLSSWALDQFPLAEWMVEEMTTKYNVPNSLANGYIASDQVLPLLDGLDEVEEKHRSECVKAINDYHKQHDTPLVVCSRRSEYTTLNDRVRLRAAVLIEPLTSGQVEQYLSQVKVQLPGVLEDFLIDPKLQEVVTTPLMLNIFTIAYAGTSKPPVLSNASLETRRQKIFTAYIERVLHRKECSSKYPHQQVIKQLSWLAWNMKRSHSKEFTKRLWENINFHLDWLPDNRSRKTYQFIIKIVEGLIWGLALGMLGAFVIWFLVWIWDVLFNTSFIGLGVGLFIGLGVGSVSGLIVGYLKFLEEAHDQFELSVNFHGGLMIFIVGFQLIALCILYFGLGGLLGGLLGSLLGYKIVGIFIGIVVFLLASIKFSDMSFMIAFFELFYLYVSITGRDPTRVGTVYNDTLYNALLPMVNTFILRLILDRTKTFPIHYSHFLDYATERILLRKVGSNYIFIHQLLLEHFATLYDTTTAETSDSNNS